MGNIIQQVSREDINDKCGLAADHLLGEIIEIMISADVIDSIKLHGEYIDKEFGCGSLYRDKSGYGICILDKCREFKVVYDISEGILYIPEDNSAFFRRKGYYHMIPSSDEWTRKELYKDREYFLNLFKNLKEMRKWKYV